jgi:Domain of unknown function (DUF4169)
MTEIINLNRARKAKTRVEDKARAAENRIRFGRTKAQKAVDQALEAKAAHALDQTRREP